MVDQGRRLASLAAADSGIPCRMRASSSAETEGCASGVSRAARNHMEPATSPISAHQKRRAPAVTQHDEGNKWRSDASADADSGENDAVGHAAFVTGYPARDKLIRCRINDGFTRAKEKTDHGQDHHRIGKGMSDRCRKRGEDTPPQNSRGKHTPWTETVGEPSGRSLAQRVSKEKGAEDEAEADVADGEFLGEFCSGNGKIHAIEVGNRT